tara:strand:- start:4700 stop:5845 length:1146 start_codon:yes stop_codon:yes gene_type:complete
MKIIGMIPARMGSKRVKNKNLRLINHKPLIQYILDAASQAELLDDIYINSESSIFKDIASKSGVRFYLRDEHLASDSATNDDFALDFMQKVDCDILIQLLPTSPFLSTEEIDSFIRKMIEKEFDTLISVSEVRIESIFKGHPINFVAKEQTPPSQLLEPVKAYACGIMGWKATNFKQNFQKYGAAYHGADGKVGFFDLKGFSTVDIDNEEDFRLAEAIVAASEKENQKPQYYKAGNNQEIADANVARILNDDGVKSNNQNNFNLEKVSIDDIINKNGRSTSWSHTVINSVSNSATLIAQMPGEGNRLHYHHDWDEWWYIVEGEWEWLVEGVSKTVKAGEVVFIQRNRKHKITAKGEKIAIRLAVSRYDVDHVYEEDDYKNL